MFSLAQSWCLLSAYASTIQTASLPLGSQLNSHDLVRRQTCTNGPTSRDCWSDGFDINTNVYTNTPSTGQTVTYDLTITNTTCNPDGHAEKWCQLINNQYPGPTIRAQWGDTVRIVVHNDLQNNGTSIHWHGIRQLNTCQQDGTNGITECPIAPGSTRTYEWKATQYGTTWYHSHHTAQYGEGALGTIIIDGPATANYDEDLGVLPLTDWFYQQVFTLLWGAINGNGAPPPSQNVLVNGSMIDGAGNGQYTQITVEKGKTYRLRFVNTAVDHLFHVSIDNHPLTVIAADFVTVKPYQTTDLKIGIGQRYDIVFTADQDVSSYWLRIRPGNPACGQAQIYSNSAVTVGAILNYQGANSTTPTSTGLGTATTCDDEVYEPFITLPVPSDSFVSEFTPIDITFGRSTTNLVNWFINSSSLDVDWEMPTLEYVREGNTSYIQSMNVIEMPQANEWYFWVIQNTNAPGLPHPIHLHGHDFYNLGSGSGSFPGTLDSLNFDAPMRRDVALLPASGWLVLAFPSDNPGAWLMHCHIAWHVSQGLGLQFLERSSEIIGAIGSLADFQQGCNEWSQYWDDPARQYDKGDSGLRRFNGPPK
jgi:FtsP/CotA-like multicopper oxidase with cupredoxin domain